MSQSSVRSGSIHAVSTVLPRSAGAVSVRVPCWDDVIRTLRLDVVDLDASTDEIRFDGHLIGFISRDGRLFRANAGTRFESSTECGHYFLWDEAAAMLVNAFGIPLDT